MRRYFVVLLLGTLSALTGQSRYPTGEVFDPALYNTLPLKAKVSTRSVLPPRVSLETYCPTPGDQGEFGTCAAWSSAYHFRTIIEAKQRGLTDRAAIDHIAYSPTWVYEILKNEEGLSGGRAAAAGVIVFLFQNFVDPGG